MTAGFRVYIIVVAMTRLMFSEGRDPAAVVILTWWILGFLFGSCPSPIPKAIVVRSTAGRLRAWGAALVVRLAARPVGHHAHGIAPTTFPMRPRCHL
jgi:hypothetical protein